MTKAQCAVFKRIAHPYPELRSYRCNGLTTDVAK